MSESSRIIRCRSACQTSNPGEWANSFWRIHVTLRPFSIAVSRKSTNLSVSRPSSALANSRNRDAFANLRPLSVTGLTPATSPLICCWGLSLASDLVFVAVEPARVGRHDSKAAVGDVAAVEVRRRRVGCECQRSRGQIPFSLGQRNLISLEKVLQNMVHEPLKEEWVGNEILLLPFLLAHGHREPEGHLPVHPWRVEDVRWKRFPTVERP